MQIGIFTRTFLESNLEMVFQKMTGYGIFHTQLNLSIFGGNTMPLKIDDRKIEEIKSLSKLYGITIDAMSGTFNMIDPNLCARQDGCRRFHVLCEIARELSIPIISLCTGSKNLCSKWRWHVENNTPEAFNDLLHTTDIIIQSAHKYNRTLGVEIERSNIINSALRARNYLDIMGSKNLKIIMDGANLFSPKQKENMGQILKETFRIVGKDMVLAHAKDISSKSETSFTAAGQGVLDYDLYLKLLREYGYGGSLMLHSLREDQIEQSVAFIKEKIHGAI